MTIALIVGYFIVMALLDWVVEPYLRLRHEFFLAQDTDERNILKFFVLIFWPIGIPIVFFISGAIKLYHIICFIEEQADQWWKPKPKSEKVVDESKSDYRNISFIERK